MDSDDISLPERCEKQVKRFEENPKLAMLSTSLTEFVMDSNESAYFKKKRACPLHIMRYLHTQEKEIRSTIRL